MTQVTLPSSGPLKEARIQQLLNFHSGPIVGLAASPYSHMAVTAGTDGTVRLHDYRYMHIMQSSSSLFQPCICFSPACMLVPNVAGVFTVSSPILIQHSMHSTLSSPIGQSDSASHCRGHSCVIAPSPILTLQSMCSTLCSTTSESEKALHCKGQQLCPLLQCFVQTAVIFYIPTL